MSTDPSAANSPVSRLSEVGIVKVWLKPFTFKVRMEDGSVILCGLARNYFGRMTPDAAKRHIEENGPKVGDEVRVMISDKRPGGLQQGTILRQR